MGVFWDIFLIFGARLPHVLPFCSLPSPQAYGQSSTKEASAEERATETKQDVFTENGL